MARLKHIGVQPTATARRRMCCGGKRSLQTGCPTKHAASHEHGYSRLMKAKSETSAQRLPAKRLAAPHIVAECVSRYVNLGKTHSTK